jgi:uncharacterized repeat protein (TIGR01451 family)
MRKIFVLSVSAVVLSLLFAATTFAATYTVTNTNDAGAGSLRRAINDANGNPGADVIDFNIPPYSNIYSIQPVTALPAITEEVLIDGFTQSVLSGTPDTVYIEVNGSLAGAVNGLRLTGGSNVIIRGLAVNGFANNGIRIDTTGNTIYGCMIGVGTKGVAAKPNGDNGILINGGTNNKIGDPAQAINVISGNTSSGVRIQAGGSGNSIQNNYIGVASDGITPMGNGTGVEIRGASTGNTIGGTVSSGMNVISGNATNGVEINNVGSSTNTVSGNYIGLGADSLTSVGNGTNGVLVFDASINVVGGSLAGEGNFIVANGSNGIRIANLGATLNGVYGNYIGVNDIGGGVLVDMGNAQAGVVIVTTANTNYIGGLLAGQGNVVSGNDQEGIEINGDGDALLVDANDIIGNYIGTDSTGAALGNSSDGVLIRNAADNNNVTGGNVIANNGGNGVTINGGNSVGNLVSQNSIHSNTLLGVDLGNDGVDVNDLSDGDGGPNNDQNYPVVSSVTFDGTNTNITGTFNSLLTTNYDIELYSNSALDASTYGEGETYLQTVNVNTDGVLGDTTFSFAIAGDQRSLYFTTLAYDSVTNDTSEFSKMDTVDISVAKTVSNAAPDVSESITYTLTVTNNGPDTATGVNVKDIIPGNVSYSSSAMSQGTYNAGTGVWNIGTMLNGASVTLSITGSVNVCGSAGNTASVTSVDQHDSNLANDSASASYSNSCPVAGGRPAKIKMPEDELAQDEALEDDLNELNFCADYIFEPKDSFKISRYEFLDLMLQINCFEIPELTTTEGLIFSDLDNGSKDVVSEGYKQGIISGYADGTFKPYNPIFLAEAAKIIFKSTGQKDSVILPSLWYSTYMDHLESLLGEEDLDPASFVTKLQAKNIVNKIIGK